MPTSKPKHEPAKKHAAPRRTYADIRLPMVMAVVDGFYRFRKKEQAEARLAWLRERFVLSRKYATSPEDTVLWVRGWCLMEDEEEKGYRGHFARVTVQSLPKGKWTLAGEKVDAPLADHPQKERPPGRHPDWGYPALRTIKKGGPFASLEEAQALLDDLQETFPDASVPGRNRLYLMVYSKQYAQDGKAPVKKYIFDIEACKEGSGFLITVKDNERAPAPRSQAQKATEAEAKAEGGAPEEPEVKGYFSAKALLKRRTKRPIRSSRPPAGSEPPEE